MERHSASPEQYDATHALADAAAARESIARRLTTPWWYHPILGLNLAALVLVTAFVPLGVALAIAIVASVAVSLALVKLYQRVTGLWIGPQDAGPRSRRVWLGYAVVISLVMLIAVFARTGILALPAWTVWLAAAVSLVATVVLGRRMDELLREEIRDCSAPAGSR